MFDFMIIGGGASGLAAAIEFKKNCPNFSVAVVERLDRVGKKLSITGNSRCNVTNRNISLENYHGKNPEFCLSTLESFTVEDTEEFFTDLGVIFKTEKEGRVYPYSLQASSVVDALRFGAERLGVVIIPNTEIRKITPKNDIFHLLAEGKSYDCRALLIATGGKAGGKIASDSGYKLLGDLGHKQTALSPAIVQVKTDTTYTRQLKGVKVNANVTVNGRTDFGEVLFCDYGLSGPPILQLSRYMHKGDTIFLDLMPEFSKDKLEKLLAFRSETLCTTCGEFFCGMLQKRLGQVILKICGYSVNDLAAFDSATIEKIAHTIKNMTFEYADTNGFPNAQVTHGGIATADFDPLTLMSRICRGLFACGEVLDIDGDCGGYNLQWAWSSGVLAARSAARFLEG